jgi:nuclear pore complex protein Nup155
MGVMIGCQATLANGDYVSIIETLLRANEPVIKDDTAGRRIEYTSRHDGLALTLARFLRPIWQSRVTAVGMGNRQMLGVSEYQLQTVQSRLEQLKRFIEQ